MAEKERYRIVWQECGANNHAAERFYVPGYKGYLPFLISGDEVEALENKENVLLQEEHLLKGILYGLYEFDNNSKFWHQKEDKETLLYLLDELGKGFKFDSPEQMVLDVASTIREKNGNCVSRVVLEVGSNLIPKSSKIKSDLICDLWSVISEHEEDKDLFEEIIRLIEQIDFEGIYPDAIEIVCYYGLCAMVFLKKDDDIDGYLEKYIYPHVEMRKLKDKITALMKNPTNFSPLDMKLV
ncbi:MAG: hypothetical protein JZU65_21965 [Chlorobium sp.]|nr:hypothetical protein [Chlorobium sp.]